MVTPVAQRMSRHKSTVFIIRQGKGALDVGKTHKEAIWREKWNLLRRLKGGLSGICSGKAWIFSS
jgi:hypothetical protein